MGNAPKGRQPRIRVTLETPAGTLHQAQEPLPAPVSELLHGAAEGRDKKDLLQLLEGIVEAGSRAVLRVATTLLRSLQGRRG